MPGNLAIAYNTVVEACNRPLPSPCLYSMDTDTASPINGFVRRMGGYFPADPWIPNVLNVQYFDCSGLMGYALWKAGYFDKNPGFTTHSMGDILPRVGFRIYSASVEWRNGDILWYNQTKYDKYGRPYIVGHTEMVIDASKNITGGAGGRGTEWGNPPTRPAEQQVEIHSFDSRSYYPWQYLARDESAGSLSLSWIYKNDYNTESETWNNAYLGAILLSSQGYSMEATCGILGNAYRESLVQPLFEERGGGGGYGILQWTPKSDLTNIVTQYNLGEYQHGDVQLTALLYETGVKAPNTQWYDIWHALPNPMNFTDFDTWRKRTDQTPEDMAQAFMMWYERPGTSPDVHRVDIRRQWARKFYDAFKDGLYNGSGAYNSGIANPMTTLLLIDYMRRKNNKLTP